MLLNVSKTILTAFPKTYLLGSQMSVRFRLTKHKRPHPQFPGRIPVERSPIKYNHLHGSLKDLPEWSYLDGSPAPPSMASTRRREIEKQICTRIVEMIEDIDKVEKLRPRRQRLQQMRKLPEES